MRKNVLRKGPRRVLWKNSSGWEKTLAFTSGFYTRANTLHNSRCRVSGVAKQKKRDHLKETRSASRNLFSGKAGPATRKLAFDDITSQ
jgi:hypothetical protein